MQYQLQATQTIYKYFTVEADTKDEALEIAQDKNAKGEIRFDDEPFLKMETDVKVV